jgi:hypothetical protein
MVKGLPSDKAVSDKLSIACEGIPACNSTVANPFATILSVVNDLYSAVIFDEAGDMYSAGKYGPEELQGI